MEGVDGRRPLLRFRTRDVRGRLGDRALIYVRRVSEFDPGLKRRLLESELELNALACDEVVAHEWGRSFLSPSLPDVWDANFITIERPGLSPEEVLAAADGALAARRHRKVVVVDEDEGRRLGAAIARLPGWEVERILHMVWEGESGREPPAPVAEVGLAACAELRYELILGELPAELERREEAAEQLVEWGRRLTAPGGDRWFLAPAESPAATCCLLGGDPAQIDDVATLPAARGKGLATSVVLAALAASLAAGHRTTFLSADADDWPRRLYAKLGFVTRAEVRVLRRLPST